MAKKTYEEAKKIAEDQKYSVTGNKDGIDENYIKAIQNGTENEYIKAYIGNGEKGGNKGKDKSSLKTTSGYKDIENAFPLKTKGIRACRRESVS